MGRRFLLRPLINRVNGENRFPALTHKHKTYLLGAQNTSERLRQEKAVMAVVESSIPAGARIVFTLQSPDRERSEETALRLFPFVTLNQAAFSIQLSRYVERT